MVGHDAVPWCAVRVEGERPGRYIARIHSKRKEGASIDKGASEAVKGDTALAKAAREWKGGSPEFVSLARPQRENHILRPRGEAVDVQAQGGMDGIERVWRHLRLASACVGEDECRGERFRRHVGSREQRCSECHLPLGGLVAVGVADKGVDAQFFNSFNGEPAKTDTSRAAFRNKAE